jgi:hypothetical protein
MNSEPREQEGVLPTQTIIRVQNIWKQKNAQRFRLDRNSWIKIRDEVLFFQRVSVSYINNFGTVQWNSSISETVRNKTLLHIHILCLKWLTLWPPRILTFPSGTSCTCTARQVFLFTACALLAAYPLVCSSTNHRCSVELVRLCYTRFKVPTELNANNTVLWGGWPYFGRGVLNFGRTFCLSLQGGRTRTGEDGVIMFLRSFSKFCQTSWRHITE